MGYRKLTERELRIMIDEHAVYERWQAYVAYAAQVYGPQAAQIVVASDLVYNDETDVLRITEITVSDAAGVALNPDWSSDWWQTMLGDRHAAATAQPWDPHDWNDARVAATEYAQSKLPIPPRRDLFAVPTPPVRHFPIVYVPDSLS